MAALAAEQRNSNPCFLWQRSGSYRFGNSLYIPARPSTPSVAGAIGRGVIEVDKGDGVLAAIVLAVQPPARMDKKEAWERGSNCTLLVRQGGGGCRGAARNGYGAGGAGSSV